MYFCDSVFLKKTEGLLNDRYWRPFSDPLKKEIIFLFTQQATLDSTVEKTNILVRSEYMSSEADSIDQQTFLWYVSVQWQIQPEIWRIVC